MEDFQNQHKKPAMEAHTYNTGAGEAKTRESYGAF